VACLLQVLGELPVAASGSINQTTWFRVG
jgi:hypothetical protein